MKCFDNLFIDSYWLIKLIWLLALLSVLIKLYILFTDDRWAQITYSVHIISGLESEYEHFRTFYVTPTKLVELMQTLQWKPRKDDYKKRLEVMVN